jgi:hypothetical protein
MLHPTIADPQHKSNQDGLISETDYLEITKELKTCHIFNLRNNEFLKYMTYFFFVVKVNNFIFQLKNKKLVKVNKFEYLSRSTKLYSIIKINDFV